MFASENGGSNFAPYVPHVADLLAGSELPQMFSPLALRVSEQTPLRTMQFTADIDGRILVMQDVDTPKDHKVQVKLEHTVCPTLPWHQRLGRKLIGMLP